MLCAVGTVCSVQHYEVQDIHYSNVWPQDHVQEEDQEADRLRRQINGRPGRGARNDTIWRQILNSAFFILSGA